MYYNINAAWGRKIVQFLLIFFFFLCNFLYSCDERKDTPDTLIVTEHNNGDTVQVALGTALILKLEAIPGTGYSWHVGKAKSNLLVMIEEPTFESQKSNLTSGLLGAPAYHVFRYRAQKEGAEILELSYIRVWEKNKPPLKTFSITVNIKK